MNDSGFQLRAISPESAAGSLVHATGQDWPVPTADAVPNATTARRSIARLRNAPDKSGFFRGDLHLAEEVAFRFPLPDGRGLG